MFSVKSYIHPSDFCFSYILAVVCCCCWRFCVNQDVCCLVFQPPVMSLLLEKLVEINVTDGLVSLHSVSSMRTFHLHACELQCGGYFCNVVIVSLFPAASSCMEQI